ncbi:MAG TPA: Uma2 family endonuclease [Hyphomicrobiaceae bacterium]|jgi:Uma2 family endonuclease
MREALDRLPRTMTVAQFLDWPGDGSGRRFQLVNGELRAMSPASRAHGAIQAALGRLIGNALDIAGSRYDIVGGPGVVPGTLSQVNMRIPDLGITGTADAAGQRALPDPIVLIEILSPSNASDTWDNVWAYTTIRTLREIVVVHSTRVLAEVLRAASTGIGPRRPRRLGAMARCVSTASASPARWQPSTPGRILRSL